MQNELLEVTQHDKLLNLTKTLDSFSSPPIPYEELRDGMIQWRLTKFKFNKGSEKIVNISNYPWWASLNTVFKMPNNLYKGDPNEAPLRDMTLQGCWCLDFNELHTNIEMSENLFDEIGILLNYRSTIDVDYINNKCPVIFNFINDIELAWPDVDKDYKYQNKQFLNSLKFNIRRVRPEIYELYKKIVKTLYDNKSLEKDNVKSDWFSVFITSDEFHEYDNCP